MKNSKLFINLTCIIPALLILCMVNLKAQNDLTGYTYLGEMWDVYQESMHYYYISNCETTWEEANGAAIEMGGHLVNLATEEESDQVGQWARYQSNVTFDGFLNGAWIGLRGENGNYEWSTGEPIEFTYWGYNPYPILEPIYADGAAFVGRTYFTNDYPWYSYPVSVEIEYIVEFSFQPNCSNNPNKVYVCHNGNTICVNVTALQSHLDHGDLEGPCGPCNTNALQSLPDEILETAGHLHHTIGNVNSELNNELDIFKKITTSNDINIFPNPASDEINVAFPNVIHEGSLRIFSSTGQEIQTIALHGQQSIMIDLSDYTLGIYLIDVRSANGNYQKKFVKL